MAADNHLINIAKRIASNVFFIKKCIAPLETSSSKSFSYRINLLFSKIHYRIFNILYPNRPWTSPASILFFDKVLNDKMIGLEYGSGRSTLYFAKKLNKVISIEHYEVWYTKVKEQLSISNINNVDYFFIPKDTFQTKNDDLEVYLNEYDEYESKKSFKNYYNKVNEYPDEFFDFVLIDGRSRVQCGLNAKKKLKKGGIFVLDNSERERYQQLHKELESWPVINTSNGYTDTTIWIKPF